MQFKNNLLLENGINLNIFFYVPKQEFGNERLPFHSERLPFHSERLPFQSEGLPFLRGFIDSFRQLTGRNTFH